MRNRITPLLVLLVALFTASCERELTTEEHLSNAGMLRDAGDLLGAQIELKNAAQKAPFNMQIRREMAYVHLDLGLGAEAEKEIRRAREMGMNASEAALLLTRSLMLQGKYEELVEEAEEFPEEPSPTVQGEIMAWRGLALMELGDFELAGKTLEAARELDPESALVLAATASFEARVGSLERAREWVDRALELDPESPDALALKGDLLAAEENLAGAYEAYSKSIESRGYVNMVNARRAMTALRLGKIGLAEHDLRELRKAGLGKLAYVHQVRGVSLYMKEDYAGASAELTKGLEALPRNVPMKMYLVAALLEQERFEQADVLLGQLYEQVPRSTTVARMRATLQSQRLDVDSAQEILQDALERSGDDNVPVLGMLGALAMVEGDHDSAVDYFERVLALDPEEERAQRALEEARTVRGDYIARDLEVAQGTIDESQYSNVLLSAAAALKKGRVEESMAMAQNLHNQYPQRSDALKVVAAGQMIGGDFAAGRATMEAILKLDPHDPSTTRNLAKIYDATGERARARTLLTDYLEVHPEDGLARSYLAGLVVREDQPSDATAALEELLNQDPANHAVRARLVRLRFDAGEYDQVIVLTEKLKDEWVLAQPSLMELRGKSFANLGQGDMAQGSWEQWVEVSPDSVLANYFHGEALAAQGDFEGAMAALDRAVAINGKYLPARLAQVRMHGLAGDLAQARAVMDKVLAEATGDRVEIWRMEGWLAVREQRFERAEESFRKVLELDPNPESALMLAITLATVGDREGSLAELEHWRGEFPEDLTLLAMQAEGAVTTDPEKAIALYEEMLSLAPASIVALNNLAWLERERDLDRALDYAKRAHELLPEDPVVLDTYGSLLADSGKTVAGANMVAKAVEVQPRNMQYRVNLARLLAAQGRTREATAQLRTVVDEAEDPAVLARARELLAELSAG